MTGVIEQKQSNLLRALRFVLWSAFVLLALIGLLVVGSLAVMAGFNIFQDRVTATAISPDGEYIASTLVSDEWTTEQTLVVIARKDGKRESGAVLTYDTTADITVTMKWRGDNTLSIFVPCEPPDQIRPYFDDYRGEQVRRIIVETVPRNPKCQFPRGILGTGRQIEGAYQ